MGMMRLLVVLLVIFLHEASSQKTEVAMTKVSAETVMVESWFKKKLFCNRVKSLLRKVDTSMVRLSEREQRNSTSHTTRHFIHLTLRELNVTRKMVFRSIAALYRLIHNNVTNVETLRDSSRIRLESLRSETLREEKAYSNIKELDATIDKAIALNESSEAKGLVNGIIKEVASNADKLQKDLSDHVFDKALNDPKLSKAANVEAVIRLNEDGKPHNDADEKAEGKAVKEDGKNLNASDSNKKEDEAEEQDSHKVVKLVDANNNLFVLSKGKDSTVPLEDRTFILDIVYLFISAAVLGMCCQVFGLPSMFGHILAGILLGPSGFNILKSIVQIESVGQFGVFLILFCVGLEFSPEQVRPVIRVAIVASLIPALILVAATIGAGKGIFHASVTQSAFVGVCLSLSSTPLVVNFISSQRQSSSRSTDDYGLILLGILVMQDVYLGILMALLPSLATSFSSSLFVKLSLGTTASLVLTVTLQKFLAAPALRTCLKLGRGAALMLVLGTAFGYLLLTHLTNLSMELGCFMAGMAFSGVGRAMRGDIETLVEPVRDFTSAIFFASIGLHVFPKFLLWELTLLSGCTALVVIAKFISCLLLLRLCIPPSERARRYLPLISAGLAQVSEFSFVLGSIARRLGLCSREIYLLVLGVTTLSLLVAPFLWRVMLCHTSTEESSGMCQSIRNVLCCRRCTSENNAGSAKGADDSEALLDSAQP